MADPPDPVTVDQFEPRAHLAATLVLVRHGESTYVAEGRFQGRMDPPLSELGRRQAALVAERLAHRDERTPLPIPTGFPARIWHSPLSRAAETASTIAEHQPGVVQAQPDDRLTEIAQGDWEGQPMAVVKTRWANELAAWRSTPTLHHAPGGESLADAAAAGRRGADRHCGCDRARPSRPRGRRARFGI